MGLVLLIYESLIKSKEYLMLKTCYYSKVWNLLYLKYSLIFKNKQSLFCLFQIYYNLNKSKRKIYIPESFNTIIYPHAVVLLQNNLCAFHNTHQQIEKVLLQSKPILNNSLRYF